MMMRRIPLLLALGMLAAVSAGAEEWYDAYRQGVRALAQGRPANAVPFLERAIAQRREPGRNVITYGTNVEREYYPYLKLAEAHVQLRDAARARAALDLSARWGREPEEARQRLAARIEDLAPKPTPAAGPAAAPAPPQSTAAAPPVEIPPAALPTASAPPAGAPTPVPQHPVPGRAPAPTSADAPAVGPAVPTAPGEPALAAPATLEVVSHPPGAHVYVDDEMVGATDPEWGRLVRSGLAPGRHRVRLALAGHLDVTEEVDLAAGGRTDFRRRLTPAEPTDWRPFVYGAVALGLLGLTVWAVRRVSGPAPAASGFTPTPRVAAATPTPRGTPPGMGSPGMRREADGREFFGPYHMIAPLGRGGMASVFKASRGGEVCALKRPLQAFLEEPEFLERFLREAEIGRALHHPNVIRILERGEVEGVPFFTMELLPGETLQSLLDRVGALPARRAVSIVVQIAEALDYAHSKGVVHRDLKPSNVMVLSDGTAKVMDFGIARARRFEGLTVTGAFLGSPDYIAPEAIEGRETDARSDLYSLGVTFYETLTGRRPFTADTPFAVLRLHMTETPIPPSSVCADVPPELDRIVMRLLSKTPADRHGSAEELVQDLRDFLNRAA
jgi:hypothetical protein